MKSSILLSCAALVLATASACARKETAPKPEAAPPAGRPAASATTEKTYELRGKIVSRDVAKGTVTVDHEKIEGLWDPMTMGFELRGGDAATLPPDGSRIRATLHAEGGRYWLTDVRPE
ncbi:MAG TPA: copper-binding protein [Thermoanaerobaculia bacterium]|nr:copper-binding protein [Thermoanaerobaculia bacterium]